MATHKVFHSGAPERVHRVELMCADVVGTTGPRRWSSNATRKRYDPKRSSTAYSLSPVAALMPSAPGIADSAHTHLSYSDQRRIPC